MPNGPRLTEKTRRNGSTKTWATVVVSAVTVLGAGFTAKQVNTYRTGVEHRITKAEEQLAEIKGWRDGWIKDGALPVDNDQNAFIAELQEKVAALEGQRAIGTRLAAEDVLPLLPCGVLSLRTGRRIVKAMVAAGLLADAEDVIEQLGGCIGTEQGLADKLRERKRNGP